MTTNRIAVVGGGLAGLASACVLAARGYSVTLFEHNPWPGGKAAVLERDGYRFDMGPTILTIPSVLRRIFAEANRKLEDYLTLLPCDPQWRTFYNDGSRLDLVADAAGMAKNLEAFAPGSSKGYTAFLDWSKVLHDISDRFFFWKSIGGLWDMFEFKSMFNLALLRDVLRMRMGKSVASAVRSYVPEPRVAQMIDHFTQYVGSSPDASPAILCGIAHMQTQEGIWYPLGGTGAVPRALAKLAGELGVEMRLGEGVKTISYDAPTKKATGVVTTKGEAIPFAAVVSNCDSVRTHRELIQGEPAAKFEKRRNYEAACSGVVLYLGLDRAYEHLAHHNFVFSRDPHEEFEYIYTKGQPAPDPTAYVCAPSRSEPGVAPPGGEALYVLVHTPYLRPGHDWSKMLPEYRRVIIEKLKTTGAMPDLESRIRFESVLTPQDINDRYHVLDGAIYGLASHGTMFGAFKPANRSPDVKGLYLTGGAAHPGPGMPMVLMSGWIAADTLDKDRVVTPSVTGTTVREGVAGAPKSGRTTPAGDAASPAATHALADARARDGKETPLPRRVEWRVNLFTAYCRRMMAKNFHAVRVSKTGRPESFDGRPVLVVLNHPSWWDPIMGLMLAGLAPSYKSFAPIDAAALKQYRIFEPLGVFGVEIGTTAGAMAFLKAGTNVLSRRNHALWVTAQGGFVDPRTRPIELRPGVGHLARRLKDAVVLPLAIEYPFWQERYPEALAHFGEPILVGNGRERTADEWTALIAAGMTTASDALAVVAATQDAANFDTLVGGSVGVGGVYDVWRRVKSLFGGPKFTAGHEEAVRQSLSADGAL